MTVSLETLLPHFNPSCAADRAALFDLLEDWGILVPRDRDTISMARAFRFFWDNAGWSYRLGGESEEQGRARCAAALMEAEDWADDQELEFEWGEDTEGEPGEWYCFVRHGERVASLHAIALDTAAPCHDWYCRVVQAELAAQLMDE